MVRLPLEEGPGVQELPRAPEPGPQAQQATGRRIGLPGIDGYEVARRVGAASEGGGVFLVALTGYGGNEARDRALAAGFDLHITEPIEIDELPRVIDGAQRSR